MMTELQNIAASLESGKLAQGKYSNDLKAGLEDDYPRQGTALYTVTVGPDPLTSEWIITAEPKSNELMSDDGDLTLNYRGIKCREIDGVDTCGTDDSWN